MAIAVALAGTNMFAVTNPVRKITNYPESMHMSALALAGFEGRQVTLKPVGVGSVLYKNDLVVYACGALVSLSEGQYQGELDALEKRMKERSEDVLVIFRKWRTEERDIWMKLGRQAKNKAVQEVLKNWAGGGT